MFYFDGITLNVFDTWLCFPRSIILIVKQNDCVKGKNICLKPVPGNQIVARVKIKITSNWCGGREKKFLQA